MIKEVIVVEGKDDRAAVKRACDAEVIITNGLGITRETMGLIRNAQKRCGVIILTDPDYPGEKIRKQIEQAVSGCRHAFLAKQAPGRVGVEYASPQEILHALEKARVSWRESQVEFTIGDLQDHQLIGQPSSAERRARLGQLLGLGKTNAKQFLNRLNAFQISREEFEEALSAVEVEKQ